jgi:pimeloyl-ACP methyl ester carboxylesterase
MHVEGRGPPLLVIPGIQGRWQWMRPGIRALAMRCRVAAYGLAGDPEDVLPSEATCFDDLVRQAINAMSRAGMARTAVCGVSYGALIATRLAARYPDRVSALILVSPLPPGFKPDARIERLIARPRLMAPAFLAGAPRRTLPELRCARPSDWPRCGAGMVSFAVRWPQSPVRMAKRVQLLRGEDFIEDARQVVSPTLVLTGDDQLDSVVPPAMSRRYLALVPGSVEARMTRTGHFGMVTRPAEFARLVGDFVDGARTNTAIGESRE